ALIAGGGVLLFFIGLAQRPSTDTGQMLQQRLMAYEGERPLTLEEQELQLPFSERFVRPAIERFGKLLSDRTPENARRDLQNKLNLAGKPYNLTPSDFTAVRYAACVVLFLIGLLLGVLMGSPVNAVVAAAI